MARFRSPGRFDSVLCRGDTLVTAPWALHLNNPNFIAASNVYNWVVTSNSSGNIDGPPNARPPIFYCAVLQTYEIIAIL